MKVLSLIGNLSSIFTWAGVLTAVSFYSSPDKKLIAAALSVVIIGLMTDKAVRVCTNRRMKELERLKTLEWSWLNFIRLKLESGENVDTNVLEKAKAATFKLNDVYQRTHGFKRPGTGITPFIMYGGADTSVFLRPENTDKGADLKP